MPRFFNPNVFTQPNMNNENQNVENNEQNMGCCHKHNNCCMKPECPTIYKECPPICTCSKQVINQYHITKQPYIHNYHTEVVHHYVTQNEFIPTYTCSEVHVNEENTPFR